MQTKGFHVLTAMTLLGVSWLAVFGFGPAALAAVGVHAPTTSEFSAHRPVAPGDLVQTRSSADVLVLNSWQFTHDSDDRRSDSDDHRSKSGGNPYGDATKDVLQALSQTNEANLDAAQAVLGKSHGSDAPKDLLQASNQLAEAAIDTKSAALKADAQAMQAIAIQAGIDRSAGNITALFLDTQRAQMIANKAVLDASPFK